MLVAAVRYLICFCIYKAACTALLKAPEYALPTFHFHWELPASAKACSEIAIRALSASSCMGFSCCKKRSVDVAVTNCPESLNCCLKGPHASSGLADLSTLCQTMAVCYSSKCPALLFAPPIRADIWLCLTTLLSAEPGAQNLISKKKM